MEKEGAAKPSVPVHHRTFPGGLWFEKKNGGTMNSDDRWMKFGLLKRTHACWLKSYFILCIHVSRRCTMWHQQSHLECLSTILVVLGKTWHQKRRKKVKGESLGKGESGAGCWDLGLQTKISDQMKKIIQNTLKAPTAQNQHTYLQGGWKKDKNMVWVVWQRNIWEISEWIMRRLE